MHGGHVFNGPVDNRNSNAFNSGVISYGAALEHHRVLELVTELRDLINLHAPNLPNGAELSESADMLAEHVSGAEPKPRRIHALLSSIAAMAGSISSVTNAVDAVRAAIGS